MNTGLENRDAHCGNRMRTVESAENRPQNVVNTVDAGGPPTHFFWWACPIMSFKRPHLRSIFGSARPLKKRFWVKDPAEMILLQQNLAPGPVSNFPGILSANAALRAAGGNVMRIQRKAGEKIRYEEKWIQQKGTKNWGQQKAGAAKYGRQNWFQC